MDNRVINSKSHSEDKFKRYQNRSRTCNEFHLHKGSFVSSVQKMAHLNEFLIEKQIT